MKYSISYSFYMYLAGSLLYHLMWFFGSEGQATVWEQDGISFTGHATATLFAACLGGGLWLFLGKAKAMEHRNFRVRPWLSLWSSFLLFFLLTTGFWALRDENSASFMYFQSLHFCSLLLYQFCLCLALTSIHIPPRRQKVKGKPRTDRPVSERRGFMFIDMNSATKMAEQLGHSQYSAMLKFCFKLLEEEICRYQWHEIYQFVGDEAVITWQDTPKARKIHNHQLFEGFKSRLRQHSSHFQKNFGATPTFKCAIHIGEVIKTQMGGQNQQIAYHGDAVNTTSRILDLCHQMGTDLLLSTPYFEAYVAGKASGQFLQTAPVQLNGKQMPLSLFKPKPCLVNQAHIHPFYSQKMTISQNQPS